MYDKNLIIIKNGTNHPDGIIVDLIKHENILIFASEILSKENNLSCATINYTTIDNKLIQFIAFNSIPGQNDSVTGMEALKLYEMYMNDVTGVCTKINRDLKLEYFNIIKSNGIWFHVIKTDGNNYTITKIDMGTCDVSIKQNIKHIVMTNRVDHGKTTLHSLDLLNKEFLINSQDDNLDRIKNIFIDFIIQQLTVSSVKDNPLRINNEIINMNI